MSEKDSIGARIAREVGGHVHHAAEDKLAAAINEAVDRERDGWKQRADALEEAFGKVERERDEARAIVDEMRIAAALKDAAIRSRFDQLTKAARGTESNAVQSEHEGMALVPASWIHALRAALPEQARGGANEPATADDEARARELAWNMLVMSVDRDEIERNERHILDALTAVRRETAERVQREEREAFTRILQDREVWHRRSGPDHQPRLAEVVQTSMAFEADCRTRDEGGAS